MSGPILAGQDQPRQPGEEGMSPTPRVAAVHPGARTLPSALAPEAAARHRDAAYLPTLFDRLCDDAPSERSESPDAYVASRGRMREIVLRDLSLLLNTTDHSETVSARDYPLAASSCVNYGVPPLAGGYLSDKRWGDIERMIRTAITRFEPRLMTDTLQVRPLVHGRPRHSYNVLTFEISGHILMHPYPIEFTVQSAVDLENSRIELRPR